MQHVDRGGSIESRTMFPDPSERGIAILTRLKLLASDLRLL